MAPTVAAVDFLDLGEAPRLDVPQDVVGPVYPMVPKAARTRSEVAQLYRTMYLPGNSVPIGWTGSIADCNPGTTSLASQQAVIDRVNYYRALADLPGVTLLGGMPVVQAQAAALVRVANATRTENPHNPPPDWRCYSADALAGAGASNLALGTAGLGSGVNAIDGYMRDPGAGNTAVGHRRWILFPPRTGMATGDTVALSAPGSLEANALYVFGPTGPRPATPNGVAWPPAGFVPYQNLPGFAPFAAGASNRWSWSFPGADFANAVVTMSGPAGPIAVTREPLQSGFGDNTIVWLPTGFNYGRPTADTAYTVTITGIAGAGVPPSITYTVTVIDPDAVPPPGAPPTATAIEYYNETLDHYFLTHGAAEIDILDAGVVIRGWRRTGQSFKVFASAGTVGTGGSASPTSPVCRFYIPPDKGDSHFYGRGTVECNNTGNANPTFVNEDPQFFHMVLPVAGVCPAGLVEVSRVFSNRLDANHRYLISTTIREQMVQRGWLAEGDGPNFVVMCAPA